MHVINFDPAAEFCISDADRRLVLEDIQQWNGALMRCNATIGQYNEAIK
jgi:hypothetical protein